jgi:NDP-sugar pyrophosphorylase family protein
MDALVLAGGIPQPGEPLYEFTQGKPKALLDISGKPMVQWVLDALSQARSIDRVVVVSLEEDSGLNVRSPSPIFLTRRDVEQHPGRSKRSWN